jgi:hypothetical protein
MEVNNLIIPFRRKATNTVANACIPKVLENVSIINPKAKASKRVTQRGI